VTVRRHTNLAEAGRNDAEYWRRIPAAERILLAWQLSDEQWRLAGHPPR